jgi:eukaryotic-like serine/threonine-protein kinase
MLGDVISHYRIIEKIGSGAMGEVFRAHDDRLGRDVALKLIRPSSSANPDHVRRFELEARAAASLNHPNIVAVYDVGVYQDSPYIVCELLEGNTLRTALADGALPTRVALDYAQQIVQGLITAHSHRIIHRDLKPENLFVTSDGRIKILDFGVAKLQLSPEESGRTAEQLTTVTKSGSVIGTVAYMSPEQLRGKTVDHRSDIFSVGAILYEMLTGRQAFRGETEVDTITAVLREEPPHNGFEQARVPESCREIVRHSLDKDPENRFQSARDLAFALSTLANATPGKLQLSAKKRSLARIVPWALVGTLLVAVALLLGLQIRAKGSAPSYQRLTFQQGTIYSARFAPDFRSVLYGAAWNGAPVHIFSTLIGSHLTQPLNLSDANLLAISRTGELALALHGSHLAHLETEGATLARSPPAGGSPREVLENVSWADWDSKGELAVVHHAEGRDRIEYPIGHVLFQSDGWISHVRLSPDNDRIAFIDHPALWDDRGSLCVVDLSGNVRRISQDWASGFGLAWSADGDEIWFTAAETGIARRLLRTDLSGEVRHILDLPMGMTLEDVAPDGRILISLDSERLAMATVARNGKPRDLSWHDWNVAKDISPDGQSILFEDASEAAGAHYLLGIRKIDGTPPIQLGEGSAGRLSPDGNWAISIVPGKPGQLRLIPIGAGQTRIIALPGIEQIRNGTARFLADGKHVTINANEPGHEVRCYIVDFNGGKPVPITPEGITNGLVSPDGRYVLYPDDAGLVSLYPINGGQVRRIPDLEPGFALLQWSEDSSSFYGYYPGKVPTSVYKVELATGKKTPIQEIQPDSPSGVLTISPIVMTPDASRFAYSYSEILSVLFVISRVQ